MRKNCFIIDGLTFILKNFCTPVYAEEPAPNTTSTIEPSNSTTEPINYEKLIANARKEEKEKLYPQIKKLKEDLENQVKLNNDLLLKNAALQESVDKGKQPDPRIAELESEIARLNDELEKVKESAPNEQEIRDRIEKEYEVKLYLQEQKDANKDKILGILMETISGDTKEAVDAAIKSAIDKTSSVRKELGLDESKSSNKPKEPETPPKRTPKKNPSDDGSGNEYTLEYIQSLDPSSDEYKEFRRNMGFRK